MQDIAGVVKREKVKKVDSGSDRLEICEGDIDVMGFKESKVRLKVSNGSRVRLKVSSCDLAQEVEHRLPVWHCISAGYLDMSRLPSPLLLDRSRI